MIKLKDILQEACEKALARTVPITKENFDRMLPSCSDAVDANKQGYVIYRGLEKIIPSLYASVNPSEYYRYSMNTTNFYTALIDVLPSWVDYPKRSRSIICSTSMGSAGCFGNTIYQVFPQNGASIGICPKSDFWGSFKIVKNRLKYAKDMDLFNYCMESFIRHVLNIKFSSSDLTPSGIINILKQMDDVMNNKKDEIYTADEYDENIWNDVKQRWKVSWMHYFDELLDPENNEFMVMPIKNFNVTEKNVSGREVWTDAYSLLKVDESR